MPIWYILLNSRIQIAIIALKTYLNCYVIRLWGKFVCHYFCDYEPCTFHVINPILGIIHYLHIRKWSKIIRLSLVLVFVLSMFVVLTFSPIFPRTTLLIMYRFKHVFAYDIQPTKSPLYRNSLIWYESIYCKC